MKKSKKIPSVVTRAFLPKYDQGDGANTSLDGGGGGGAAAAAAAAAGAAGKRPNALVTTRAVKTGEQLFSEVLDLLQGEECTAYDQRMHASFAEPVLELEGLKGYAAALVHTSASVQGGGGGEGASHGGGGNSSSGGNCSDPRTTFYMMNHARGKKATVTFSHRFDRKGGVYVAVSASKALKKGEEVTWDYVSSKTKRFPWEPALAVSPSRPLPPNPNGAGMKKAAKKKKKRPSGWDGPDAQKKAKRRRQDKRRAESEAAAAAAAAAATADAAAADADAAPPPPYCEEEKGGICNDAKMLGGGVGGGCGTNCVAAPFRSATSPAGGGTDYGRGSAPPLPPTSATAAAAGVAAAAAAVAAAAGATAAAAAATAAVAALSPFPVEPTSPPAIMVPAMTVYQFEDGVDNLADQSAAAASEVAPAVVQARTPVVVAPASSNTTLLPPPSYVPLVIPNKPAAT